MYSVHSFRGSIAPASLKVHAGTAGDVTALLRFRGSIAPASLKGEDAVVGLIDALETFPGLYCPGLIEGPYGCKNTTERAAFPGLYCPGLIEGPVWGLLWICEGPVSGALLPRPH